MVWTVDLRECWSCSHALAILSHVTSRAGALKCSQIAEGRGSLLMIAILHDLLCKRYGNSGSIVYTGDAGFISSAVARGRRWCWALNSLVHKPDLVSSLGTQLLPDLQHFPRLCLAPSLATSHGAYLVPLHK